MGTIPIPTEIVRAFASTIWTIARAIVRRLPSHVDFDDLVAAGYMGLVDAYRLYDRTLCDNFEAYAPRRIKGAMIDELRLYDPLSRDLRSIARRVERVTLRLQHLLGRQPTEVEMAESLSMNLTVFQYYRVRIAVDTTLSLSWAGKKDHTSDFEPIDDLVVAADEQMILVESLVDLRGFVRQLQPHLRKILRLYYLQNVTAKAIGKKLGVTETRIYQLRDEALQELRVLMNVALKQRKRRPTRQRRSTPFVRVRKVA